MNKSGFLTEAEIEKLILSLASGQKTFSEDDARIVVEWAETVKIDSAMLKTVLDGRCQVSVVDGEVAFRLTDKGRRHAKKLVEAGQ